MPKHVGLAMTMRHITGSKQVVTILNRMGHCSSYDDVEIIDTSLAAEVIAQTENSGVVIPTNITPGPFVQMATDNNDLLEHTLDGKHTTHSTTLVMYQKAQFGPKPQKVVYAEHSTREKSLKMTETAHEILECGAFVKKPSVKFAIDEIKKEWYEPVKILQERTFNLDLVPSKPHILYPYIRNDQGQIFIGAGGG